MKVKFLSVFFLLLLAVALSAPLSLAQDAPTNRYEVAGIENPASVEPFLRNLQSAVARGDRAGVAARVNYPLTVKISGRKTTLRKSADLVRLYSRVFTPKVKQALARQKAADLFVNWQGVMIGDGEIWFGQPDGGKTLKIIAINS